ncbi:MAG: bifunctional folylpolyglutamate synthase/dihydrofolate synthase [Phycisphaerales bacterium]|nr:MAG: bifunctional folylpolyglutamate synthase/dihydrofolate synthase [Phycisphaerales bacterium]
MSAMGDPHQSFKTVHIAGTKGKGSTAAMLAAMLHASGMKVGLYTSPHVLDVRERIAIDGQKIPERAFTKAVAGVAAITAKARVPRPTYFELLTAAAFSYFAEEEVDIAVIETGLGGRLDATNVVTPEVVGITSISYDHLAQLGTNLESITCEKAGIIKKGIPVVSAPQRQVVRDALGERAKEIDAPLAFSDENVSFSYRFEFSRSAGRHARICFTTSNSRFEHLHVPLLGEHQAVNCTLALRMLDTLKTRGFDIDDQEAMNGLAGVELLGRMQTLSDHPRILVDGAHNAASIRALIRAIGQNISYDSMVVIFASHKDKDISGMLREIQLGADKIIFTETGTPRTADPAELAAEYTEISGKMVQVTRTLKEAMRIALSAVSREDLICITGSFYIVSEAIRLYSGKSPT